MTRDLAGQLRALPSVDEVVVRLSNRYPHNLLVEEVRRVIASMRDEIREGGHPAPAAIDERVTAALEALAQPSLRQVINATGVVLHTNLGRAPLPRFPIPEGYTNLEYDLASGRRGKRDVHAGALLQRLLGKPGIVVNNNAAAIFLVLNELAAGGEVVISRGELIEIGDGFRIPDIMARAGAILREVGTTNRTRIEDYREAINVNTRVILRVHPSNFHMTGFTGKPELKDLAQVARDRCIPLYEDLGSGCMVDLRRFGITEPLVTESIASGANVVTFSGDKLLGGPQAGIIAGDADLVARIRRNPMFRALRVDKLIYSALRTTLANLLFERYDAIPALRMLSLSAEEICDRAERICAKLSRPGTRIVPGQSLAGGGSTPDQSLATWLIAVEGDAVEMEKKLRSGNPPVIARLIEDRLVLDLRTVLPEQDAQVLAAIQALS